MHHRRFSSLKLAVFLAIGALLVKIYQHNRMVALTHQHQHLSLTHAALMNECMQLRQEYECLAGMAATRRWATRTQKMRTIEMDTVVDLSSVITKG